MTVYLTLAIMVEDNINEPLEYKIYCLNQIINQFSARDYMMSYKIKGQGYCPTCQPSKDNQYCRRYYPIKILEYKIE